LGTRNEGTTLQKVASRFDKPFGLELMAERLKALRHAKAFDPALKLATAARTLHKCNQDSLDRVSAFN
jgi:hypothetical protein